MHLHSRTTRSVAIGATLILGSAAVPGVLGWGAAGHEMVATIAQIYTQPAALDKICKILNDHDHDRDAQSYEDANSGVWPCHLASIATWADKFKYRMRWSAPLHYVGGRGDHPSDTCLFPGSGGWENPEINVLGGIHNTSSILLSYADGEHANVELAQEALKFIVHFIGDLHMPLHLTGRDRGGNSVDICWDGRRTNLHSAWDGLIVAKGVRTVGYNYTKPLPAPFERVESNLRGAIYDPLIRKIIWEGVEGRWAGDLDKWLSCSDEKAAELDNKVQEEEHVWKTLRDFFLPGWFAKRAVQVPVTDTEFICPYHWSQPIHALNCELIWPKQLDSSAATYPRRARCKRYPHQDTLDVEEEELDTDGAEPPYELDNPDYMGPIEKRMLLEQFIGQAGVRLAATLNYIFGEGSSVEHVY